MSQLPKRPGDVMQATRSALERAIRLARANGLVPAPCIDDAEVAAAAGDLRAARDGLGPLSPVIGQLIDDALAGATWGSTTLRYDLECDAWELLLSHHEVTRSMGLWASIELASLGSKALGRNLVRIDVPVASSDDVTWLLSRQLPRGGAGMAITGLAEHLVPRRGELRAAFPEADIFPLPPSETDWEYGDVHTGRRPTYSGGDRPDISEVLRGHRPPPFALCCHCAGDRITVTHHQSWTVEITSETERCSFNELEYQCQECGWYTGWRHCWTT